MRRALGALARRAALLALVLLVAGISMRLTNMLDRYFIYFPDRDLTLTPGDVGLAYEDVFFSAADGVRLHGWYVPGRSDTTLVWFHGNGGDIGDRVDNLALLQRTLGVNVFLFDYRGYGRSEGTTSERGIYLDAEAAVEYVRSRRDPGGKLVFFGRSLGCAVAVEMAIRHQPYAVILESPFTSVRAMAGRVYPFLPVGIIIRMFEARYDSLSKIGEMHSPLMVLHGDRDDIVPFDLGRELYDAANEPKRFYTIEGAGHNDTYLVGGKPYFEALRRFVESPGSVESR